MKGYKNNEEAKDKFVSEQRKEAMTGAKRSSVPVDTMVTPSNGAPSDGAPSDSSPAPGESTDGWRNMFDGPADLALERKKAAKPE
jgi:hypothetical protein